MTGDVGTPGDVVVPGAVGTPGGRDASKTLVAICALGEIPPGAACRVTDQLPEPIAVFNADGVLYAISDTCTHQDASLSDGWLEGCTVECPLHASCFDLRTGEPASPPAKEPVQTYPVVVVGETVYVDLGPGPR